MLFNKLLNSKWTSVNKYKEWYHYQVLNILKKDKRVEMYAICKKDFKIVIHLSELKNKKKWISGWKYIID